MSNPSSPEDNAANEMQAEEPVAEELSDDELDSAAGGYTVTRPRTPTPPPIPPPPPPPPGL